MRGLQVWSEGRKRRVGAGLKGLPWVARGGKHGKGAAAAAHHDEGGVMMGRSKCEIVNERTLQDFGSEISSGCCTAASETAVAGRLRVQFN